VFGLLEGKTVNLRIMEKEDIPLYVSWINDPAFYGDYNPLEQTTKAEMEKNYDSAPLEKRKFFIEKKDGTKIGVVNTFPVGELLEIGYTLIPSERGKGYCTEAVAIMIDYLFLSRDLVRIQAHTDLRNVPSQRVLSKVGFKKEGVVRKSMFMHGEWRDEYLYSVLREEWKEPKILTKAI
jgi:RimJ/RimL family protein N-acetyltransferase